ncbi:hypothetical protein JW898_03535 [Candidatus Woesearchaeota archaeon]|nr:hypothetical protein [Candidatus Woesearchaeota archaeon]
MDRQTIDAMTFAEFAKEFSTGTPTERSNFYLAPNEYMFSAVDDLIKMVGEGRKHYFMGVIGGVDMAFNHIANLAPENAFLFDVSEKALAYLGLRLCLFRDAENMSDYYLDMIAEKGEDRAKIWNAAGTEELLRNILAHKVNDARATVQGNQHMKSLGYRQSDPVLADILYDPDFRRKAAHEGMRYLEKMLVHKEGHRSWLVKEKYGLLRQMAAENRIRGFNADFFGGFQQSAQRLIKAYGINHLVIYISNLTEIASRINRGKEQPKNESALARITDVCKPIAEQLESLWVIDSRFAENRILGSTEKY